MRLRGQPVEPTRRSSWRHLWLGVLVLGVLALADGAGILRFGRLRLGPDLVLAAVVAWAFLGDASAGATWGFLGGLMLDAMSAAPFATHTLPMTAIGAALGAGRLSLYADDQVWVAMAAVAAAAVYYASVIGLMLLQSWPVSLAATVRLLVLPSIAIDGLAVLLLLPLFRLLHRRLFGNLAVAH
jgi:rod shape-determining protein MreD